MFCVCACLYLFILVYSCCIAIVAYCGPLMPNGKNKLSQLSKRRAKERNQVLGSERGRVAVESGWKGVGAGDGGRQTGSTKDGTQLDAADGELCLLTLLRGSGFKTASKRLRSDFAAFLACRPPLSPRPLAPPHAFPSLHSFLGPKLGRVEPGGRYKSRPPPLAVHIGRQRATRPRNRRIRPSMCL